MHMSVLMRPARRSVISPWPSIEQKLPRAATSVSLQVEADAEGFQHAAADQELAPGRSRRDPGGPGRCPG